MRIVITSAPKTGNHWIKCLLAEAYGLRWISGDEKSPTTRPDQFRAWMAAGQFPDGSIFHQHCRFSRALVDEITAAHAHLVTIVRDPYDMFISMYSWVQEREAHDVRSQQARPRDRMIDKPLGHPDVLAFLTNDFGSVLRRSNEWLHSGRALVVRYEELHADPIAELRRTTVQIEPIVVDRLTDAVEACRAENLRQRNEKMQWHVRSARIGESRERLGEEHLQIFRDRHATTIRSLGYEVR